MGRGILAALACAGMTISAFGFGAYFDKLVLESRQPEAVQTESSTENPDPNLVAQQMTAFWTRNMGLAAMVGIVLSALGIVLVYRTLLASRAAANTARSTYDAFVTVERAKIVVSVHDAMFQSQSKALDLRFTNIGKSHCTVTLAGYLWNSADEWTNNGVVLSKEQSVFVGAGTSEVLRGSLQNVPGKKDKVFGFVKYVDILGERRSFFAFSIFAGITGAAQSYPLSPDGMPDDI